jgi:tetratricopeptide (TPR) repeat protein
MMKCLKLLLLLFALPAIADVPAEWKKPENEIHQAWRLRKEVVSLGRDTLDSKGLERIRNLRKLYSLENLPTVSYGLLNEVRERSDDEKSIQEERLNYVRTFSDSLPILNYFHCPASYSDCIDGVRKELSSSKGKLLWLSNLFYAGFLSLIFATLAFLVYLIIKYRLSVSHLLAHQLSGTTTHSVILVGVLIGVISYLMVGWIGPPLVLIVFFWRYMEFPERAASIALMAAMALVPLGYYAPALYFHYENDVAKALENPLQDTKYGERGLLFMGWLKNHPKDAEAMLGLALVEKEAGRYEQAKALLEQALKVNPGWSRAATNLANVEFITGDSASAVNRLQSIVATSSQPILVHFNLSKIFYKLSRLDEALIETKKAKDMNPSRFTELDGKSNPNDIRMLLIDDYPTPKELQNRVWTINEEVRSIRDRLHRNSFPVLPDVLLWATLVATLAVSILTSILWPVRRGARSCDRCGLPSCSICDPQLEHESLCSQCYHMYVRLESIDPNARKKKENSIARFRILRDVRESWITFVTPGVHQFFRGNHFRGIFTVAVAGLLVSLIFSDRFLIPDPYHSVGFGGFPYQTIALVLFGVTYILSAVGALRR